MANYVKSTLTSNEVVIYEAKLSLWAQAPAVFFGLCLLPLFGVGLIVWLAVYLQFKSTELAFTNKRVIAKHGFINRQTIEMNIAKAESLQVNQDIIGRIFDFGTIIISGAGNPQAPIAGIFAPMTFRKAFMEYQDEINDRHS